MKKNKTFTLKAETLQLLRELEEKNSVNLSAFADRLLSRETKKILKERGRKDGN